MTATNHALTGAAIGLLCGQPWLALPLAVVSHYICDALPHYAHAQPDKAIRSQWFRNYLLVEALLCAGLVAILSWRQPPHWWLAALCAFLAAAPDFLWITKYRRARANRRWQPSRWSRFAARIQWFQRPVGVIVELAWLIAAMVIIQPFIS